MSNEACAYHILHIASGDLWAGAEVQLFTLATALKRQDVNVSVVLMNHGTLEQRLVESGVSVIVLDESRLNGLQLLSRLAWTMRELRPDIVHTHRIKENILGSIAAWRYGRIPCLRTVHGASEHFPAWYNLPKRAILVLDRLCGRFLQQRIIAVSDELAVVLATDYPAKRIRVVENGIDVDAGDVSYNPSREDSAAIRVGIVGRLVPVKRIDLFIETASLLRDRHAELNASFHIYGDGPLADELHALSSTLQTNNIVHFEGHCEDIHDRIHGLDILLITSDHEGLPMTLLEAMQLGTPVIAHDVGGITRVLDRGAAGILVSDQKASAYAEAVWQLATHSDTRQRLARAARARVLQVYSAEHNARAYCDEYKALAVGRTALSS